MKRGWLFSLNCFVACAIALYVAFLFDLGNPSWAMLTVYLTSQPIAGAVVSKAFFRVVGTLVGVTAALLIVSNLSNAPELMLLAMAIWLGLGLYLSLINRGPHSYAFMLAGYTVALVGLPQILNPYNIFDTAVARAEEIVIGVVSAILTHGLLFPLSAERATLGKLTGALRDTRGWIRSALMAQATPAEQQARRRLAADLAELTVLAGHLPFEPLVRRAELRVVHALEQRMLGLLPLLSAVEDRVAALHALGPLPDAITLLLANVSDWVGRDDACEVAERLLRDCRATQPLIGPSSSWGDMLVLSLLERLVELIAAWRDTQELACLLRDPNAIAGLGAQALMSASVRRPLYVDRGMAALSAVAAALGLLVSSAFAMAMDWSDGFITVGITAVLCSLFAAADDPTALQRQGFIWTLVGILLAVLYEFGVLQAVDGYVLLMAALAPALLIGGLLMTNPRHALGGLTLMLIFAIGLGLQDHFNPVFDGFITISISLVIGSAIALGVTALVRVVRAEFVARRILRAGWGELAALAAGSQTATREGWSSRMLDRLNQLLPRLAKADPVEGLQLSDALNDLRLGVDVVELRETAKALSIASASEIRRFLSSFAEHLHSQQRTGPRAPSPGLLIQLDSVIARVLCADGPGVRMRAAVAGVGLRRNLFPGAEPYRATGGAT
jgi:uncharacterized membrane protein YccC